MAEFSEVMRQWSRMCGAMLDQEGKCENCGLLKTYRVCCGVPNAATSEDFAEVERVVMAYAAEHPEPVYPSIAKYLERFGIIICCDGSLQADFFKANKPMSADMAKLLGISPGEGENEKTD